MRQIKFRVWDVPNERMVYDPYQFIPAQDFHGVKQSHVFYESWQDVDDGIWRECVVMQYTGLKDKNGKEIYEGDLLKTDSERDMLVGWNEKFASFCVDNPGWTFTHFFGEALDPSDCEVVGNMHEDYEKYVASIIPKRNERQQRT